MSNKNWAKNPSAPPEALAMLSTSANDEVRLLVVQNPNTPATALWHLSTDENPEIRAAALERVKDLPKPEQHIHAPPPIVDGTHVAAAQTVAAAHTTGPKQPQGFLAWLLNFLSMNLHKS